MLLDSGSTHDFISTDLVKKHNISTTTGSDVLNVTLADGSVRSQPITKTDSLKTVVGDFSEHQQFLVFPMTRYDVILGKPWLTRTNPQINFRTNEIKLEGGSIICQPSESDGTDKSNPPIETFLISGKQARHAMRGGAEGILAYVTADPDEPQTVDSPGREDQKDFKDLLKEFGDVFPDELPNKLPPRRGADHEIKTEEGAKPPSRAAYRLPKPEMDELQAQLTELLRRGFIQPSKSPYGAPVFFVKKADGTLRMVCDWRELNRITIKNKACLPNIDDLFDTVQGSAYFTKLDLRSGYNQIRIEETDIPKTAINTPFGHFQFTVMGFGLTNAPATFQTLMNSVLQPYLRKFVVVFLDDILIFSKSWEEHLDHVRTILNALRRNELYCKPSKCEFGRTDVLFLGHRIDGQCISPDPEKIKAVHNWPVPTTVTHVRQFLGFANYFRRFINHFSAISKPLEELTGKHVRFEWNQTRQEAFERLKSALLDAPVLRLANVSQDFRVETDASDFAVAGVLTQQAEDQSWHPVAYVSRKLSSAERNYTAAERETLAVVYALQCWRVYLFRHFQLYTDNMGVVYLRTKPNLTKREARWIEFLADYDYTVHHKPGKCNIADPLSRRPDLELNGIEFSLDVNQGIANQISAGYDSDPELSPVIKRLMACSEDAMHERYVWNSVDRRLYLVTSGDARLCIPRGPVRLQLLKQNHDCLTAGHPGRDRTYLKLSRYFYWPGMRSTVKDFVKSCDRCQRVKGSQTKAGLLQSLPVPEQPWTDISMDFIMALPLTCRGHSAILTFVDRLTKYVHLIPTTVHVDSKEAARLYVDHVFAAHGLSKTIVCDRDPRFTSAFFKEVFSILGVELKMSTANHPQTDGMTERVNRVIEDTLRAFVNHRQNNWDELLSLCEFAINNADQASTGNTPFFLNHGCHPVTPSSLLTKQKAGAGMDTNGPLSWLDGRVEALREAQDAIVAAQARQSLYADRGRVEDALKEGDEVLVFRDFLLTPEERDRPSHKLRLKWYGPFKVQKKVAPNAYRLALPRIIRAHPVFNIAALKLYHGNEIPGRTQPAPPPLTDADGHTRYIVEKVLSHKKRGRRTQYLVKWKGYRDATWEPEEYLMDEAGNAIIPLKTYLDRFS